MHLQPGRVRYLRNFTVVYESIETDRQYLPSLAEGSPGLFLRAALWWFTSLTRLSVTAPRG